MAGNPNIRNLGKRFSSEYQPDPAKRKPSVFSHLKGFMTENDIRRLFAHVSMLTREELDAFYHDPKTPAIATAYVKAVLAEMEDGKVQTYERILDRLFGRPAQRTELTGRDGSPVVAGGLVIMTDDKSGRALEDLLEGGGVDGGGVEDDADV